MCFLQCFIAQTRLQVPSRHQSPTLGKVKPGEGVSVTTSGCPDSEVMFPASHKDCPSEAAPLRRRTQVLASEKSGFTYHSLGFPRGSAGKGSPSVQETQETQVRSLGWEDPLGKEIATHSIILA